MASDSGRDFLQQALAYAQRRWCWDDESFIEEMYDFGRGVNEGETPEEWIDSLAEKYDLLDPRDF